MDKKDMAAQIAAWKKKHGDVFAYEADGKTCYLHRPSRTTIAAASVVGKEDPFKFAEIVLANCCSAVTRSCAPKTGISWACRGRFRRSSKSRSAR